MQPESSPVPNGPELAPSNVTPNGERIPMLPTPENGLGQAGERYEQVAEVSAAAADAAATGMPPPPLPTVVATPTTAIPAGPSDSPAIAADEDLIEKEWVDKAKKIILETKDDPYARSTRVNELQRDYLKKRYSKDLGSGE